MKKKSMLKEEILNSGQNMTPYQGQDINPDLTFDLPWLLNAIQEAAKTGIREDGTYWRASYTPEDKAVVQLLDTYMKEAGMETFFDAVGNLHGVLKGRSDYTVMTGSHRDTVRGGGKYDGILGILAGICAAGGLYQEYGKPEHSLEVIATVEEESSRFTASNYIGSCNLAGIMPASAFAITDADGITIQDAAVAAGYQGMPPDKIRKDILHFVELHIEQGGVLEAEKKQIGIVTSIVGQWGGSVIFYGKQNHAGTTPMKMRRDPVPVMTAFIHDIFRRVKPHEEEMVATIGKIELKPGNANVIPEQASFTFDIRSASDVLGSRAMQMLEELKEKYSKDVTIEIVPAWEDTPILLDGEGIREIEELCKVNGLQYKIMTSGAGHDSQNMAQSYLTNVIFVPSEGGISHDEREFTKPEDLDAGLTILSSYLKKLCWDGDVARRMPEAEESVSV